MGKDFKKIFGSKVRHYRNLLGYSQEKLAERIGISAHTVSYIERGKNFLSMTKIPTLCNALEIEPYRLFINTDADIDADRLDEITRLLKAADNKQLGIILNLLKNILDV